MKERGLPEGIIAKTVILALCIWFVSGQCPSGTTGFNCVACPDGCDVCDNSSSICDTCSKGYYLDINTSLCNTCPNSCLECDNPFYCITCTPGYDSSYNAAGEDECTFNWWKWFLIIFGTLLGIFLLGTPQPTQAWPSGASAGNSTRRTPKTKKYSTKCDTRSQRATSKAHDFLSKALHHQLSCTLSI
jgi:hypothetical protein